MPDSRPNRRILGIGALGRRLILAFVVVALFAVAVVTAFSSVTLVGDSRAVVRQQQASLTVAAAASVAAAARRVGLAGADLVPVTAFVARSGGAIRVTSAAGGVIATSPGYAADGPGSQYARPVAVRGRREGTVTVRFDGGGIAAGMSSFVAERWRVRIAAAAAAALLALVASFAVTRRIAAPLERLLTAMRARQAGDRNVRIWNLRSVGVLREVLEGFNASTNALDARDRVQRNLVANMAHEVRTPVAVLQAGLEAMLDGVTELSARNVSSLHDEVLRLGRMIDDLQELAAAESAALQLSLAAHDLAAIAADAAASLADAFDAAGIDLVRRFAEVPAECDAGRMREVVTNLLTNALKFTPRGGRAVVESGPDGRNLAMVRVSDTGIGIPAAELPLVTERFFRGERSAGLAPGSGIGLAIVSELVRAHHGELDIASQVGSGTSVTITLPRAGGG